MNALIFLSVITGRHPNFFFKYSVKIFRIIVSNLLCDRINLFIRTFQQSLCLADPELFQER